MEIVIKIPKELYKQITVEKEYFLEDGENLCTAVANGTPLPKGHGRLIDVGQCDRELFYQQCGSENSLITVKSAFNMLMSLPTIIEADTENEENYEMVYLGNGLFEKRRKMGSEE